MTRSILISGASGGLGRALCVALCQKGHRVAGLGRRADALQQTADAAGHGFLPLTCDVADWAAVKAAADKVRKAQGPIDILINNAAVYPRRDTLDETPQSFAETMAINLGGMVNCIHGVLPDMVETGKGRILNVSTFADISPLPASSAYSVSKGAGRILTKALIADLADRFPNIVIGDWMPGMLATQMGIPDGLSPQTAARWGAALALWDEPSLTGTLFEQDREVLPPRGLKGKIKDLITFQRRKPRQITPL